jgi:hypothetical protein
MTRHVPLTRPFVAGAGVCRGRGRRSERRDVWWRAEYAGNARWAAMGYLAAEVPDDDQAVGVEDLVQGAVAADADAAKVRGPEGRGGCRSRVGGEGVDGGHTVRSPFGVVCQEAAGHRDCRWVPRRWRTSTVPVARSC